MEAQLVTRIGDSPFDGLGVLNGKADRPQLEAS
jgi:hypothetical protein